MLTRNPTQPGGTVRPATLTSSSDGRDHLVSADATTTGLLSGRGEYLALCGRIIVAAPLVTPPGPTCRDCETAWHRTTACHPRGPIARLRRRLIPTAVNQVPPRARRS